MEKTIFIIGTAMLILLIIGTTHNYLTEGSRIIYVGYLPSSHQAALFAADELELFDKNNLSVQLVPFSSGAEMVKALEQEKIDIGYCGITPVTAAIDKGYSLKIVAPVNLEGSGIVNAENSNIEKASDLENTTVAIPKNGSIQDLLLHIYLKNNHVNFSNINITESEVPMMPFGLQEDSYDSYVAWEPFVSIGKDLEIGKVLVYSQDIWPNHPCCIIVTSENFIKNKPLTLSKFLKVHVQSTQYIIDYPEKNIYFLSKKMGTLDEVEMESLNHIKFVALPNTEFKTNIMQMIQFQKEMGYINNNLSFNQVCNFNYIPSQ
ncbi:ABC transporter substrate-binding protein [Methanobacterium alcaliphilum]|uniref:ABC transporter substrate-binding protein n=1 Tax=Methanobacterium alcaliphilum TaxID=392018 RepID=UPI00200B8A6C|nr:ABC transporter substrate-binding protein [Methanobacterium alcaliphilum]MCK9150593.1 ABC transporter substrate-binding protein [Methanobacterium alcaliphilum]